MFIPSLSPEVRSQVAATFSDDAQQVTHEWHQLAEFDSELQELISERALELFPHDPVERCRAIRLGLEILRAVHTNTTVSTVGVYL